jgi:hypothetical protein
MTGTHTKPKKTIWEAWAYAADDSIPFENMVSVAVLAVDADNNPLTRECIDDYLYGYGSQYQPSANPQYWAYYSRMI